MEWNVMCTKFVEKSSHTFGKVQCHFSQDWSNIPPSFTLLQNLILMKNKPYVYVQMKVLHHATFHL